MHNYVPELQPNQASDNRHNGAEMRRMNLIISQLEQLASQDMPMGNDRH
jgi:hypothetical protein